MDKERRRSKKHAKKTKKKRRRSPVEDEIEFSDEEELHHHQLRQTTSLVEYSDVSSDDFSEPEAGEIETDPEEVGLSPISPEDTTPPLSGKLIFTFLQSFLDALIPHNCRVVIE